MTTLYRDTLFLPATDFSLKTNLPEKEREILSHWENLQLGKQQQDHRQGCPAFVLHDGPPYANGHLHIGHALNKILKDVVNRSQYMAGYAVHFTPGWDCHGLPIEWKVEEAYRSQGQTKKEVDQHIFRKACRDFAQKWVNIQSQEFQRMGLLGSWDAPYTTMAYKAEARIVEEFFKIFMKGYIHQRVKPVMWSVVEETALAEAEVEYHDITSPSLYIRFPLTQGQACAAIWTTTPWTLPGNRAVAYGPHLSYVLIEVKTVASMSLAQPGEKILIAQDCLEDFVRSTHISSWCIAQRIEESELKKMTCQHPLFHQGYSFHVPFLPGPHVSAQTGTGLVHTAPSHGLEDFALGQQFNLDLPQTVEGNGTITQTVPLFGGQHVFKVDEAVIEALRTEGTLLGATTLQHSYPHSWRSKKKLIYRTTAQWFMEIDRVQDDGSSLRQKALAGIDRVRWLPSGGKSRITSMVQNRPDWCLSRQRAWGVPIPLFLKKGTNEPLYDSRVNARIVQAIEKQGAEVWFRNPLQTFLEPDYQGDDFIPVTDILDVWFDSGVSHAFALPTVWPASLYLEGSDQHRGWFQSSLLTACATRKEPPYRAVLTHGFVLDEQGRKMSKSTGNVVAPQDIINKQGADILRLWAVCADSHDDVRIGPEILKRHHDLYRRLRNTFRYLLSVLPPQYAGGNEVALPELERWVLHRLWELNQLVQKAVETFCFRDVVQQIHHFCAVDLSAFYFDIRKDTLYCDAQDHPVRKACLDVMYQLLCSLTRWLAPVLPFTAEEVWLCFVGHCQTSIHLERFPNISHTWHTPALGEKYKTLRNLRRVITGAIEKARAEKRIGSSLQAQIQLALPNTWRPLIQNTSLEELALTSSVLCLWDESLTGPDVFRLDDVPDVHVIVQHAIGEKCPRCWKFSTHHAGQSLCERCQNIISPSLP